MKGVAYTQSFKKDLKKIQHKEKIKRKMEKTIEELASGKQLTPQLKMHKLRGRWSGCYECHIESDYLLVWKETPKQITFIRSGSHSNIFR